MPQADDFEEPITDEMLGAASTLIREWAESLLKMKFTSLSALARHLVENLHVDTRSLAAVCILSASGDAQSSSNNKGWRIISSSIDFTVDIINYNLKKIVIVHR